MKKRELSPQQEILKEALSNPPQWLIACAQRLKDRMTPAEEALWIKLQLMPGWQAQVPLHRWIVDFYHSGSRIALEVDGGIHSEARIIRKDNSKDSRLWYLFGIRVIRIVNRRIFDDVDSVLRQLQKDVNLIQALSLKKRR